MNWKAVAGAAIFASVVSLLAGLIRANPFGTVLIRTVLSALFLGGFVMAALLVVRRFLPELEGPAEEAPREEGPQIDIVIPEENPHEELLAADDDELPVPGEPDFDGFASGGAGRSAAEVMTAGEAEALLGGEDDAEPAEELAEVGEEDLDSFSGLRGEDALPDIGGFGGGTFSGPGSEPRRNTGAEVFEAMDPADLAKAVRTMNNKDQQG
jgi:hypothetical protein